ncbi:hypothetical protein [Enterococcus sp. DIV0756]|uniref:hypothetical protein n=1 Tax=Enterococcus sp. DIV0756 TaxID=2774636 RepID=UPI003F1F8375
MKNSISLSEATLKELRILAKGSNIKLPKSIRVIAARITEKRDEKKDPISGSRAKVVLNAVDANTAHELEKLNIEIKQLKGFVVEVEGTDEFLANINIKEVIGKEYSLENAEIALLWVSRGKNEGSYSALKLVLSDELKEIATNHSKA